MNPTEKLNLTKTHIEGELCITTRCHDEFVFSSVKLDLRRLIPPLHQGGNHTRLELELSGTITHIDRGNYEEIPAKFEGYDVELKDGDLYIVERLPRY